ncbi:MAG: RNase adapter RapZ, partial [Acidimicrobiales bacterium]|nr:RNase adapter RapZ [Acidimicrobiales bacterium]
DIENVLGGIEELKEVADSLRVIYLDASDDTLIRRFEGTRRPHPVGAASIAEAISKERKLLTPLRGIADFVLDTGNLHVHQLRQRLQEMFSLDTKQGIEARVVSFGYAHGVPTDIDLLFDVRFLENPHWDVNLRPKTGLDQEVSDFVLNQSDAKAFIRDLDQLFATVLPGFVREGKSYLTVAIGCTGGRHRSVAIANAVGELLTAKGLAAKVVHRDLGK